MVLVKFWERIVLVIMIQFALAPRLTDVGHCFIILETFSNLWWGSVEGNTLISKTNPYCGKI